jgi:hypothetical protein
MEVLTQTVLNDTGCDTPDCGHDHSILFIHSGCHPEEAVEIAYHKDTGTLLVSCSVCEKAVAEIAVAP